MIVSTLRQRTFRALFSGAVFDQISHTVGWMFTPLYLGALGASPALVGLVIGVTTFANPLIILSAGFLIERVPPRRLIFWTRTMVAFALLVAAVSQTWWQLAPALALISAGSLAYPAISRAIAETTPPESRARAFFLVYGVGSNVSLVIAPAIGGVVAEWFGLRWIYLVALALELAAIACFLGIVETAAQRASRERQTYRDVVRHRPVVAISALLFVAMATLTAGIALLPTYLFEFRGLSEGTIGWLGSLSGVGGLTLAIALARVRRRISVATPMIVALAMLPAGFALLAVSANLWLIALGCFISGAWLMVWPMVDAAVGNLAPERIRGRAFALSEVFGGSGVALGPIFAGALYAWGPRLPLIVALGVVLLALLPATLAMRRYLERAQSELEREDALASQAP